MARIGWFRDEGVLLVGFGDSSLDMALDLVMDKEVDLSDNNRQWKSTPEDDFLQVSED